MLICFKCKTKITDFQYVELGDKYYHLHHYKCDACEKKLTNEEVHQGKMKNGRIGLFCNSCYSANCYPICEKCKGVINGAYYESFGKYYHHEHFACGRCDTKLDVKYRRSQGRPVCEQCFGIENDDKCKKCGEVIDGKRSIVGEDVYHFDCFKCKKCKKFLGKGKVFLAKGVPYHEKCFVKSVAPVCFFCKGKILGDYLISKKTKKKIHSECLEFYKKMEK